MKYVEDDIVKDDYDAIADEIFRLRDMRKQFEVDSVVRDEQMKQISDLQDFIKAQPTDITEFDETLDKKLIARITVFENRFTVDFKSDVTAEPALFIDLILNRFRFM